MTTPAPSSAAARHRLWHALGMLCGLGLGLVISRAIVEAHGGHLLAETADHGVFRMVLPIEGKNDEDA